MADSDFGGLDRAEMVKRARKLHWLGLGLTTLWIVGSGIYALCVIDLMWAMKPDEFATFLSGVFAPVAFLWLVLGFMQQGDELRNSAEALWLQGEELHNSVEQQRQLVELTREQMAFEAETRARSDLQADRRSQPLITLRGNIDFRSGDYRKGTFTISSAKSTCTDVEVKVSDGKVFSRSEFVQGEAIGFDLEYAHPKDIEPIKIEFSYTDLRMQRKRLEFTLEPTHDPDGGVKFSPPTREGPFPA